MAASRFAHRIIGLELGSDGMGAALLRRDKGLPVLEQTFFAPAPPGTTNVSRSEPHLPDPAVPAQQLKLLRSALPSGVSRAAVSLPDEVGRIMLLELDQGWKNRAEAVEMLRWKMRRKLHGEAADLHLDFQVLLKKEGAPSLLLVLSVARQIIEQYETLLVESGFQPYWIDLHQTSLLRAFAQAIGHDRTSAFVSWYGENLTVVIMHDGVPVFWRSKHLPAERGGGERLDQELHGSLEAYRKQWHEAGDTGVFFFSPLGQSHLGLVSSLWERQPVLLEYGSLYRQEAAVSIPPGKVAAAIAAAAGRL